MTPQTLEGRVKTPDNVLVREIGGESVLLDLASECYFGLDEIGTCMWAALTAAPSIEAAYQALLADFEVEPARLRDDLERFVRRLSEAGLIEVADV